MASLFSVTSLLIIASFGLQKSDCQVVTTAAAMCPCLVPIPSPVTGVAYAPAAQALSVGPDGLDAAQAARRQNMNAQSNVSQRRQNMNAQSNVSQRRQNMNVQDHISQRRQNMNAQSGVSQSGWGDDSGPAVGAASGAYASAY